MNMNKLINEIIYYFKYFKMLEIDNDEKIIVAKEIIDRLENIVFLDNLAKRFKAEMQAKKSMKTQSKKRLDNLLLELQNRITRLENQ